MNDNDDGNQDPDAGQDDIDAAVDPDANQIAIAPADNDSAANPAVSQFLSITGTRDFTHTEEVSAPQGDAADFVEFEFPNNSNPAQVVRITLDCTITGQTDAIGRATVTQNGGESVGVVDCNSGQQTLTVNNTQVQLVEVSLTGVNEATHMDYTLTVVGFM